MDDTSPRVRYRINVNRLAKGQMSFDCTCEVEGTLEPKHELNPNLMAIYRADALAESDKLVKALQERYPLVLE